jgi:hypothetical protein
MSDQAWMFVPVTVVLGFWAFLIVVSRGKARVRELQIRERIALIEKGHIPAPEVDPLGFQRATAILEHRRGRGPHRHRSAGITLVGVGLGLMLMIAFAGEAPQKAVGVGGFIVMLGIAFIINGLFDQRETETGMTAGPRTPPVDSVQATEATPKTE